MRIKYDNCYVCMAWIKHSPFKNLIKCRHIVWLIHTLIMKLFSQFVNYHLILINYCYFVKIVFLQLQHFVLHLVNNFQLLCHIFLCVIFCKYNYFASDNSHIYTNHIVYVVTEWGISDFDTTIPNIPHTNWKHYLPLTSPCSTVAILAMRHSACWNNYDRYNGKAILN